MGWHYWQMDGFSSFYSSHLISDTVSIILRNKTIK
jgi:hypothetical protein